jgi:ribosomal protein S18 acetylase RimI-like enzyme
MEIQNLSHTPFETIVDCFLKAFEGYFVPFPQDQAYYHQRWKAAKVDFACSYGIFDGDTLLGFIIHAIDKRQELQVAYNTGTGVIPTHRGKGITRALYAHALMDLQNKGIERCSLEVISQNHVAIHLYEQIGFKVCKEYYCFKGAIKTPIDSQVELIQVPLTEVEWNHLPQQLTYSWDNQKESLLGGAYSFYYIKNKGLREAYFIINEALNYLAQFDLLVEDSSAWESLFSGIRSKTDLVKINNIDSRLTSKLAAVKRAGLQNTVNQFEMELELR